MHATAPLPNANSDAVHDIFIGRQPILDRDRRLHAYELLFRQGMRNGAQVGDDFVATAMVLSHVVNELGIEASLGPYLGFVNCDARILMSDAIEMLPRDVFVLEVLETVEIAPELIERCKALKAMGFTLAVDDFVGLEERHRPLLDLADIIKIDIMGMDEAAVANTVTALKPWPAKLLAEKVESDEQARLCRQLGFAYFQGYFFARPAILSGKKLAQSELSMMRLLSLIMEDADTSALEAVCKPEPGLTLNLLRMTNSAASGVRQKITSLRHAITVLGRRQLQRWLQLLLYANTASGNGLASPLLQLAATRARFLELASASLAGATQELEDHAFMTGIMSLMPALLQAPMEEILKSLPLQAEVREALMARCGELGNLLALAESLEANDPEASQALMALLPGLNFDNVNRALTQALAWAGNISREAAG